MNHNLSIKQTFGMLTKLYLACAIFILGCIPFSAALDSRSTAYADTGEVNLIVTGDCITYDDCRTGIMYDAETNIQLVCAQPSKSTPSSGSYLKDYEYEQYIDTSAGLTWYEMHAYLIRSLMYYTHPDSPGFDASLFPETNWEGKAWTHDDYIALLHINLACVFDDDFNTAIQGASTEFRLWLSSYSTGGWAGNDANPDVTEFHCDSVWGRLLNANEQTDAEGIDDTWRQASNRYLEQLPESFSIYILHTGQDSQICFGFDAIGWIEIAKKSSIEQISADNASYSLAGSRVGIYSDSSCTQLVEELVTDSSGCAKSSSLAIGTYYLKEIEASAGYCLNESTVQVSVESGETAGTELADEPNYSMPTMLLYELNKETNTKAATAASSLGGSEFTISHYATNDTSVPELRSWLFKTDANGEIYLDDNHYAGGASLYTDAWGNYVLPLGHYTIQESKSSEGFMPLTESMSFDISDAGNFDTVATIDFTQEQIAHEQVVRGDFEFRKIDEEQNRLASIPFMLSYSNSEDEEHIESHVIVTDQNGEFSSSSSRSLHSNNTNANDSAVTRNADGTYSVNEEMLDSNAGIWFSMDQSGATATPNDALGALPYGEYLLEEIPCSGNAGYNLISLRFRVYTDSFSVQLNNLVDTKIRISTLAKDAFDNDKLVSAIEGACILDEASYSNLNAGETYTMRGSLVLKETGEPLLDEQGNAITSETSFVTTGSNGSVAIEYTFDASALAGKSIVVFDELLQGGEVIATHADLEDEGQTVTVEPRIETRAYDKADSDMFVTGSEAVIIDAVSYYGLIPGDTYTMSGRLIDKTTGNILRDSKGDGITASLDFVPSMADGVVSLEYTLDTSAIAGHDLVVFEQCLDDTGTLVGKHEDIEDEEQTVKTVKIGTYAQDSASESNLFDGNAEQVRIVDTVRYANLLSGKEYTITGALMDKDTGAVLTIDTVPVTASLDFIPDSSSGSVKVEYVFDAQQTSSEVLVAFETISYQGNVVATHADINDVGQTVTAQQTSIVQEGDYSPSQGISEYTQTGDDSDWSFLLLVALAASCLGIIVATTLHRKRLLKTLSQPSSQTLDK